MKVGKNRNQNVLHFWVAAQSGLSFYPRRTVFVGGLCDGPDRVVCRLSVRLFKTLSYFWNQTSEFDETLLVLFIGQ